MAVNEARDGKVDSSWAMYVPWQATMRANPSETWTDKQRDAAEKLYPSYVPDAGNAITITGKPVFDATFSHKYTVSEKEMTDSERIQFKQYQLWKTTLKIDRRDSIYEAFATSELTNGSPMHHWLGAPFPVIEPRPTTTEQMRAVRWYEHLFSVSFSAFFWMYVRANPRIRYTNANVGVQRAFIPLGILVTEGYNMHRAAHRLKGTLENEFECERFGVLESPQRLAEKARYWEKYRQYKEEWMKRYDYYVYGMRPGERYTFLSPCHIAPAGVWFNKRTDYPMRKNPFLLTDYPMSAAEKAQQLENWRLKPQTPNRQDIERPENKYVGPEGPSIPRSDGSHPRGAPIGKLFT